MESVLSPLSIWQQINRNKANVMMYAFFFLLSLSLWSGSHLLLHFLCDQDDVAQSNLQHTVVICLKEHTSDHKSSPLYSTATVSSDLQIDVFLPSLSHLFHIHFLKNQVGWEVKHCREHQVCNVIKSNNSIEKTQTLFKSCLVCSWKLEHPRLNWLWHLHQYKSYVCWIWSHTELIIPNVKT